MVKQSIRHNSVYTSGAFISLQERPPNRLCQAEVVPSTPSPSLAGKAVGMNGMSLVAHLVTGSFQNSFYPIIFGSRPTTSEKNNNKNNSKKANTLCIHRRTYRYFSQPVSLMPGVCRLRPKRRPGASELLSRGAGDRSRNEQGGPVMTWGQSHLWEERQLVGTARKQEQEAAGRADCRVSSTRSAQKE